MTEIRLVPFSNDFLTDRYVGWLNDEESNRYLECRRKKQTLESAREYFLKAIQRGDRFFAILENGTGVHIGNAQIRIDRISKRGDIGLLIGEKQWRGKGFGSEAISLACSIVEEEDGIRVFTAGCYETNKASIKAFAKAGWRIVGTITDYWFDEVDNRRVGQVLLERRIETDRPKVTLIGGGKMVMRCVEIMRNRYWIQVITAERQAESLDIKLLRDNGCRVIKTREIETEEVYEACAEYPDLCLCFGPAWILPKELIDVFNNNIYNFNAIPIPDYLGGAHYTWQILNGDIEGAVVIQKLTKKVDRGEVVAMRRFKIEGDDLLPLDYEQQCFTRGTALLKEFLAGENSNMMIDAKEIEVIDWNNKRYFPRLLTKVNGWIDWSWDCDEIERFIRAFSDPYPGARCLINDDVVVVKSSIVSERRADYHPMCYGLIVSVNDSGAKVIVKGGVLNMVIEYENRGSKRIRSGDMLWTNYDLLKKSKYRVKLSGKRL